MTIDIHKPAGLKIVYDNDIHPEGKGLRLSKAWGFSLLLRRDAEMVLFDCGWRGSVLLGNMRALGEDPSLITEIVISHNHWDHIGGLCEVLAVAKKAEVHVGRSLSITHKRKIGRMASLKEVDGPQSINGWLSTPGELEGPMNEISLVLHSSSGTLLITGCAHPGLDLILAGASSLYGNIHGAIGGFHGFRDIPALSSLSFVVPCHCTKYKKLFFRESGNWALHGGVGFTMSL